MNSTLSLNEQISTMLEPKPDFDIRTIHSSEWAPRGLTIGKNWLGSRSRLRAWKWNGDEWVAEEWTDIEAACARLLDVMPCPRLIHQKGRTRVGGLTVEHDNWLCEPDYRFFHGEQTEADRKTAICLAFIAYFSQLSSEQQEQVRREVQRMITD